MYFSKLNINNILLFKLFCLIISFISPSKLIYGYELCEIKENCFYNEKFNEEISFKKKIRDTKNLNNFFNKSNINLLEIFLAFTNETSNQSSIEIEAIEQIENKDKLIARGDVIIKRNGAVFRTNYIEYDKNTKLLKSKGKSKFLNKNQIFTSDYFEYNFSDKSGFIENIYGVIDLETLSEDINLGQKADSSSKSPITEAELEGVETGSDIVGLSFNLIKNDNPSYLNFKNLNTSNNRIQKWRFKSKKIKINNSLISSKKIIFTNDVINPPQLKLLANNVFSEKKKNKIIFISKSAKLVLDDKVSIPLGRRKISEKKDNLSKLRIGIDNEEKDGLFISRTSDPFKIKNLDFSFIPELYLQRILNNETSSFRKKGDSITSPTTKNPITFADYFGTRILVEGEVASYKLNSINSINSFDFKKLNESIRSSISLSKKLKNKTLKNLELNYFASYREKIDTGYHGIHEIYNGYGINLKNSFQNSHKKNNWSSNQYFSLGKFSAENQNSKLKNNTRTSVGGNIRNVYNFWEAIKKDSYKDDSFKFIPTTLNNELNFITDINLTINHYKNHGYQNLIAFSFGPSLTIGNYRNNFLDYTFIQSLFVITSKSGSSPFKFDNVNDELKLYLNLNQQLIKSLSLGLISYLNIDKNSDKYNQFINTKYSLNWNRRAYNIQAYYEESTQSGGLNFTIFGLPFNGLGNEF